MMLLLGQLDIFGSSCMSFKNLSKFEFLSVITHRVSQIFSRRVVHEWQKCDYSFFSTRIAVCFRLFGTQISNIVLCLGWFPVFIWREWNLSFCSLSQLFKFSTSASDCVWRRSLNNVDGLHVFHLLWILQN